MERLRLNSNPSYQFTPGAERAFEFAEVWESSEGSTEIHPPDLLCGLLGEPECRGALLLAASGVEEPDVLARWPELCHTDNIGGGRSKPLSTEVQAALRTAFDLLAEYEQPVLLATEHLLLGLAATPGEVANWLAERGVDAKQLEAEVHRLAGHETGPLTLEADEGGDRSNGSLDETASDEAAPDGTASGAGDKVARDGESGNVVLGSVAGGGAETRDCESPGLVAAVGEEIDRGARGEEDSRGDAEARSGERTEITEIGEIGFELGEAREDVAFGAREQAAVWRVMDAAANRAGEGLRVVEDYVRFVLDDRHLTGVVKQLRHDLTAVLANLPAPARHAARDVAGDVGASITTAAEQIRATARDVAMASCKRAQQALRSLEEFSKTVAPQAALAFERLRYRSYTLEQEIALAGTKLARLAEARLYVLVDGQASAAHFDALVDTLVRAEVDVIQLRDKSLPDRTLLERAATICAATRGSRTLFIMNDRADLAVLSGADGVHVGQDELTAPQARAIVGPDALVGVSTHSLEQARRALNDGADYIGVGPTFPSQTKQFAAFPGLELVRAVSQAITLPAFAIGGIDAGNIEQVIAAGIRRVALSGAVTRAADPLVAARALKQMLNGQ